MGFEMQHAQQAENHTNQGQTGKGDAKAQVTRHVAEGVGIETLLL
jgi:hypothetical protein